MGCIQSLFRDVSSSNTASPVKIFGKSKDESKEEPINCQPNSYISGEDDDRLSIHYVEATAVRTLAANTGSVAILGTTAKCKQPLEVTDTNSPSQKPQLEVRYVEATACRTLAAETGSIAILGTTADPKLPVNISDKRDDDVLSSRGSIHYVEATAVRHLAAETGTIAILASTATNKPQNSEVNIPKEDVDVSEIPVGVGEVFDSPEIECDIKNTNQSENIDAQLIPLPVLAMENCFTNDETTAFISEKNGNNTKISNMCCESNQQTTKANQNFNKRNLSFNMDCTSTTSEKALKKWPTTQLEDLDTCVHNHLNAETKEEIFEKPLQTVSIEQKPIDATQDDCPKDQQFYLPQQTDQNKKPEQLESTNLNNKDSEVNKVESTELLNKQESNNFKENEVLKKSKESSVSIEHKEETLSDTILETNNDILNDQKVVNTLPHLICNNNSSFTNYEDEQLTNDMNSNNIISNYQSVENSSTYEKNCLKQNSVDKGSSKEDNLLETKLHRTDLEKQDSNDSNSIRSISKDRKSSESESEEKTLMSQLSKDSSSKESVTQNLETNESIFNNNIKVTSSILNNTNLNSNSTTSIKRSVSEDSEKPVNNKSKKLLRQSNNFSENKCSVDETNCNEQDDTLNSKELRTNEFLNSSAKDQCMMTPIFEKCPPPKSKSFSYRENSLSKAERLMLRGTSLPVNQDIIKVQQVTTSNASNKLNNNIDEQKPNDFRLEQDNNVSNASRDVNSVENGDAETEFRLTMIESVREAVNRICEQAVEKTTAIVRAEREHQTKTANTRASVDYSDVTDCHSSEFSLPPPPPQQWESITQGNDSTWPPPPSLLEVDEDKTIGTELSFDLPDLPTEMEQIDSDAEKIETPVNEMNKKISLDTPTREEHGSKMNSTADSEMKSDEKAATTIQAVYRGFRARKYVESANAAAAKIQAGFRGYRVRQSLKNAANSTATTTTDDNSQCWSDEDQKSVVSVNYCAAPPAATSSTGDNHVAVDDTNARATPDQQHADDDTIRTDAAIKIQARVRGYVTRKRLSKEKNNMVVDHESNNDD